MPIDWSVVWRGALGVAIPLTGGFGGALSIRDEVKGWYKTLNRAPWNPPDWVFGPVWTTLYVSMGAASYLVWRDGGGFAVGSAARLPLALYGGQLALNFAWTPLFFKMHRTGLALVDIIALDVAVAATIAAFLPINKTAGQLLIPYLAWGLYATTLNAYIWLKNDTKKDLSKKQ